VLASGTQPALDDIEGWRAYIRTANGFMEQMEQAIVPLLAVEVERTTLDGVRVAWVRPRDPDPAFAGRVLMNIHGGAFILGEGSVLEAAVVAQLGGVEVLAVDYGMPPDHPFPANLEDTVGAYRALLDSYDPADVAIFGTSAGGTYTLTTILKARDLGLPLPAAGICTLAVELSGRRGYSGDSIVVNDGLDVLFGSAPPEDQERDSGATALFIGAADVEDPLVSPIYGDYTQGFSLSFLLTGTRATCCCPRRCSSTAGCTGPGCPASCTSTRRCSTGSR
jgi:acetyl esterase/lipase